MTHRNIRTKIKTAKGRKLSSSLWIQRQLNDPYVAQAQKEGFRSRAAYKLMEINKKFNIFSKNQIVLDLGASPGSWTQVVSKFKPGKIIALDLLEMSPISGVDFIQADFMDAQVPKMISDNINKKIDVILSDMSPNLSGHKNTDHIRIISLCEAVFEFADRMLGHGGVLVMKIFQGGTEANLLQRIKKRFQKIYHFKPASSRKESSEMYLIALNFEKNLD